MNEKLLSKRLQAVASYIPKGSVLADIGSDHAYLPCYAILNGLSKEAVAGEVNEGPFRSAVQQVKKSGLQEEISVRKGNGLEVISPNEVNVITIAGMGGQLIRDILKEDQTKLEGVERLILQPNVAAHLLREWLWKNGWRLIAEVILEEDGKIYEILVSEKGQSDSLYTEDTQANLIFGPYLKSERNEAFQRKWTYEHNKRKHVLNEMKKGSKYENNEKIQDLLKEIKLIEEVLNWQD
ncbi:tRNA (adenine(22)-N(1))-methyltransferase [Pseudalkalibacillus caeni]|uniref:tRNA (Adenine-N(1))-methyltransferase n=1 Tax=Exobacillus caeni TaxID=2574798 RepID=A0A5R9FFK0_9BACL|nr:tRNA (adenine(22)-N(1))-methyltransferase TrmK [Pseudalkalibacillus caeni]TLS39374.1 tRNA (adenine-N(1))-methyltransferase [Pseudalkalibacillus caeni]